MLAMDPELCSLFGMSDVMKLIFGYFTGLLPYLHFEREVAALPYMTRDFISMKYEERKSDKTWFAYLFRTFYIYVGQIVNITFNPVLVHL
jgi:hypothetical protein